MNIFQNLLYLEGPEEGESSTRSDDNDSTETTAETTLQIKKKIYKNFKKFRNWFQKENECSETAMEAFNHIETVTEEKLYEVLYKRNVE